MAIASTEKLTDKSEQPNKLRGIGKFRWLILALIAFVLTLFFYLPAFTQANHSPQLGNWFAVTTNQHSLSQDSQIFYAGWTQVGAPLKHLQLPLFSVSNNPQLPSFTAFPLAQNKVPTFYPGSALYYFGPNSWQALLFSTFHLWLLLWIGSLIVWKIGRLAAKTKQQKKLWLLGGIALLVVGFFAADLRPDYLAAISWAVVAIRLIMLRRNAFSMLMLTLAWGLMLLAGPTYFGFALSVALFVFIVLLEFFSNGAKRFSRSLKVAAMLLLVFVGAGLLAGPQLFPRLSTYYFLGQIDVGQNIHTPIGTTYKPVNIGQYKMPYWVGLQEGGIGTMSVNQQLPLYDANFSPEFLQRLAANTKFVQLSVSSFSQTQVTLNIEPDSGPFFVLMPTSYAEGWSAQVLTHAGEKKGQTVPVYHSEFGNVVVLIDPAQISSDGKAPSTPQTWTVTLSYKPLSFELGAYAAFISLLSIAVGLAVLAWLRFYREDTVSEGHEVRRVAKNSVTPMVAQLLGKVIDVGFALFTLRLLGPDGNGAWAIAQNTWLFMATVTEFGLETLTTRDIARDRSETNANYYLSNVFVTRSLLSVLAIPASLVLIVGLGFSGNLTAGSAWAIVILAIGLVPGGLSGCLTAVFRAYEKFEYTAAIQIFSSLIKVPLGIVLLLVWGVVGLSFAALVVNIATAWVLYVIFSRNLFKPHLQKFDWKLARTMLHESYPLMLNAFLINVFFQSDVFLLLPISGQVQVGWYNAAYKFINGLLIIPSTLTLALFPLFSNYGTTAKENLLRAYREALRILVTIAFPISVGTLFVAYDLIGTVSGNDYLPNTAIALQILIWFLPFSYINGVTQYVLIAINKQRTITWAVIGSVITNVGLNLIFMPAFGYKAASVMTILSEIALLVPFSFIIKNSLGALPIFTVSIRPALAALAMGLALFLLTIVLNLQNFFITVIVGGVVYLAILVAVRGFTKEDLSLLKRAFKK